MEVTNKRRFSSFIITGCIICAFLLSACSGNKTAQRFEFPGETVIAVPYPDVSFAVISDTHIYDASLGSSGAAFEKAMNSDRKLLLDSLDLMDLAIEEIIAAGNISFVLISGDLTKDGEMVNHRIMTEKLGRLADAGIAVFVVPGNHDYNSPDAVSFSGDTATPVPAATSEEFALIYADFGYNAAIMRDEESLSYVAEPVEGLWLLAIDACRSNENTPGKKAVVAGMINEKTAGWIAEVLKTAAGENKAVMAMMHHGVVEHWKGQSKLHPDYLVNDFAEFGKFLASWNVRFVFTGHYHAQDITLARFGDKFIYDIQTGSLVTAPCPIRYINISNNIINIRTDTIVDKLRPGTDFADNAAAFVKKTVMLEAASVLKRYKVSAKDIEYIANAVGDAFTAHYNGDENPELRPVFNKRILNLWGRFIYGQQKYALDGLWADLPPADNNVRLEL